MNFCKISRCKVNIQATIFLYTRKIFLNSTYNSIKIQIKCTEKIRDEWATYKRYLRHMNYNLWTLFFKKRFNTISQKSNDN